MVPWPIALISLGYAALATSSLASVWRVVAFGDPASAPLWPVLWFGLAAVVTIGLALMRPWARRLTMWSSGCVMCGALALASMAVIQSPPNPAAGLLATGMASLQVLVMRYLTRPHVRVWFERSSRLEDGGLRKTLSLQPGASSFRMLSKEE